MEMWKKSLKEFKQRQHDYYGKRDALRNAIIAREDEVRSLGKELETLSNDWNEFLQSHWSKIGEAFEQISAEAEEG